MSTSPSASAAVSGRATASGRSVATVDRAVGVLFSFARGPGTRGVTEISRELGVAKAVVHRILASLCERGLLTADPKSRRYALGPAVMELSAAYRDQLDMRTLARDAMQRLSVELDETAALSVLCDNRRVYIDQVTSPSEVQVIAPLGGSYPLHAGSPSKAFLAWFSAERLEAYLAENPLDALTGATITSTEKLRGELELIRDQGFAVSLGERQHDAGSVAAPIFDHNQEPVAVISVCGQIDRMRKKVAPAAAAVTEATRDLSMQLGAPVEAPKRCRCAQS